MQQPVIDQPEIDYNDSIDVDYIDRLRKQTLKIKLA